MTVHDLTLLIFAWRGFRRTDGNFSLSTVWNWHPWLPSVWILRNRMWGQQYATIDTVQESVLCHFQTAANRYSHFQNGGIIALTGMGILCRSEYSAQIWLVCVVFLCIPFPDCEISDHQVGTHWIGDWASHRAEWTFWRHLFLLPVIGQWYISCPVHCLVPVPTFIYVNCPVTVLTMLFWLLWRWNLLVNDCHALGSSWN
jgi:hypothetical protein